MLWQMSISSFIRSDFLNNNIGYLSDVNDWKLIPENDDIFSFLCVSLSLSRFLFLEHASQELDSNTAKLLLENQLKYPSLFFSCQLELSFAFTFIHLPTGGNGRKSNDVRLIGIVVPIAIEPRHPSKDDDIEDPLLMFKSRTLHEKGKKYQRRLNITREGYLHVMSSGNNCECLLGSVHSFDLFRMDKVLVYIIKNERNIFFVNNRMVWIPPLASLHYIEPTHLLLGNCLSLLFHS
jgi:hypothetical protein